MIYAWILQVGQKFVAHYTSSLTRPAATWTFDTEQEAIDWIEDEAGKFMASVEWVAI